MKVERDFQVEKYLSKLGWTHPELAPEVLVYREYRANKTINPQFPWEYTVYYKIPIWKWDFLTPMSPYTNKAGVKRGWQFFDYNLSPNNWLSNGRWDFETRYVNPVRVAIDLTDEFEDAMDNPPPMGSNLLQDPLYYHRYPIDRVANRPPKRLR